MSDQLEIMKEAAAVILRHLPGSNLTRCEAEFVVITRKHRGFYLRVAIHDDREGRTPHVEASFERIGKNDPITADEVVALYAPAMQTQAAVTVAQKLLNSKLGQKSSSSG